MAVDQRTALETLIRDSGQDYAGLSRLIGRNPAYIQQFIRRGTPKRLDEEDRRTLAAFFGVADEQLGGPAADKPPLASAAAAAALGPGDLVLVPRLDVAASAGPGSEAAGERAIGRVAFDMAMLRDLAGGRPAALALLRVVGDSMEPTLADGDDILVDTAVAGLRVRDGVHVLRRDDALHVKRIAINPAGRLLSIRSDNPAYPSWECEPAEVTVIGRVIWAGRRIG
jgi:phage repressor protein C with HTH and peptisase S24 domain